MALNSSDYRPFASNLIRKAATDDAEFLSTRLRDADMKELKAAGYSTALSALRQGLIISDQCYTGLDPSSGFPAVLFGVVNTEKELCYNTVWLLGTDAVTRHGKLFARRSKRWMKHIVDTYGTVGNYVDTRNTFYIRWFEWCGFKKAATVKTEETTFALYLMGGAQ